MFATLDRRHLLALSLGAGAAAFLPALPLAAEPAPILPRLAVLRGGVRVPILDALGPAPKLTRRIFDLSMPERGISLRRFPESLAMFAQFDATGEGFLEKYEAMLGWTALTAGWAMGLDGPAELRYRTDDGRWARPQLFWMRQAERRYLSGVAERYPEGRAAKRAMTTFMYRHAKTSGDPVWIDGRRVGGMISGGGGERNN
ncbi:hypothetical protein DDZ14_06595 [Maritimibacter sp. 55A14]|uniref:hypothetical protein n=1 Tax=Maritimibacter sp. 55A14 TaxID=2174844 RepID=UPI000D60CB18|nr:hypothetical protein [Maritimibacter sp. 55A14]PWE33082.1 hypothetical protein DDZ14_06595 [Maritimibacter sp. 55A14]